MRIELVKRPEQSKLFSALSPFIALGLTLVAGAIMFSLLGKNPLDALYYYFIDPLREVWSLHELAIKAAPLILIAVGLSVCYLSNNWNIGAEGQFTIGAITGSILPVLFPQFQNWTVLPMMLIMGMAGGAAYASVPAFLKARFNTNEILTSLMLVYVAQLFLDWLVRGPWRNPEGLNFPETRNFHEYAVLPEIWSASGRANWGFVFALVAAVALWFMLSRTLKGFEVKVLGQSPRAGKFAGFSSSKMVFFAFLLSGALAGLAGISEVSGAIGQLRPTISPGYGFAAIIVAFLGRLNPLGIIAAGLVLALSYLGGEAAQISIGVSDKVVRAFQGMLLFFVLACDTLIHYRIRFIGMPAKTGEAAQNV
ncbi:nucleoside ABC transporter membrane protein [Mesorhizobium albiziae]|uniref:Nucleoside ABC transporter membrane protein n=1 Tax=Neomesorhizobium albiziae TaxID=335020 RepID=A0A1I4DTF1_9HYPH|nr:ABC transporter permease [Mesorhizobium albiziae]GLS33718.1 ABC transporter permease [Mesorhizobium albiziae]SFK95940.1 nucleoside ABC transporter membrane protein [Mesorhizobium albiziae]